MQFPVLDPVRPRKDDVAPGARPARSSAGPAVGAPAAPGPGSGALPRGVAFGETGLRDFYDPAGRHRHRPIGALLADVASTRVPFGLPSVGRLSGHEVVLAEALHACLDRRPPVRDVVRTGPAGRGVGLPIGPERQRSIVAAVDRYADTVAAAVIEVADRLGGDLSRLHGRLPGLRRRRKDQRLVLAGRVLAAVAHDGALRRSGRAFWCHPDEVASILDAAWRRQAGAGSDPRLDTTRFLAYCHDAFEDTLDPVAGYLGELPVVVSPRVALAVLRRLAVPDAVEAARVLLLMTRTRATDGSRQPYLDHLDRGIARGGPYFALVKSADIHHNLTIEPDHIDPADPRAPARYGKREAYRIGATRLRDAADRHDARVAWVIHTVSTIGPAELTPSLRTDTASLDRLAAAVRDKVRCG